MNTDFSEIGIWFTDQELIRVKSFITYKMRYSLEPHYRRNVQGQGFMSFARNIGNKYGRTIFDKSLDVGKSMKKNMVKKY